MALGIGAMLHMLSGGTQNSADKYYGREIIAVEFADDILSLSFGDGVIIKISDTGQSCCEHRYMTTDDDVKWLIGKTLTSMIIKDGSPENNPDEYGVHEIEFLEIGTNEGSITFASHNEHNGYYGGICLDIAEVSNAGN